MPSTQWQMPSEHISSGLWGRDMKREGSPHGYAIQLYNSHHFHRDTHRLSREVNRFVTSNSESVLWCSCKEQGGITHSSPVIQTLLHGISHVFQHPSQWTRSTRYEWVQFPGCSIGNPGSRINFVILNNYVSFLWYTFWFICFIINAYNVIWPTQKGCYKTYMG